MTHVSYMYVHISFPKNQGSTFPIAANLVNARKE